MLANTIQDHVASKNISFSWGFMIQIYAFYLHFSYFKKTLFLD